MKIQDHQKLAFPEPGIVKNDPVLPKMTESGNQFQAVLETTRKESEIDSKAQSQTSEMGSKYPTEESTSTPKVSKETEKEALKAEDRDEIEKRELISENKTEKMEPESEMETEVDSPTPAWDNLIASITLHTLNKKPESDIKVEIKSSAEPTSRHQALPDRAVDPNTEKAGPETNRDKKVTKRNELTYGSEEKKDTNEILKNLYDGKVSKPKSEKEENHQQKSTGDSAKANIQTVRSAVDELKNSKNTITAEEMPRLNLSFFSYKPEEEISSKTNKQKVSTGLKTGKQSDSSESNRADEPTNSKIFTKENTVVHKIPSNEAQTITEKLKRTENPIRKERETVTPTPTNEPISSDSVQSSISKERLLFTNQLETKLKATENKSEPKAVLRSENSNRNFQEIVKAAKIQIIENGRNSAEILLQPRELGRVTLMVTEENNRLEGKIYVENDSARQMILGDLAGLKSDLKLSGLELFELTVDLQSENPMKFGSSSERGEDRESFRNTNSPLTDQIEDTSSEASVDSDRILDVKV